jgi:hypothetical protein
MQRVEFPTAANNGWASREGAPVERTAIRATQPGLASGAHALKWSEAQPLAARVLPPRQTVRLIVELNDRLQPYVTHMKGMQVLARCDPHWMTGR